MSILIVDDSKTTNALLEAYLKDAGYYNILKVASAEAAIDVLGLWKEGAVLPGREVESIELLLMDIVLPGMDGIEATKRIKGDERFRDLPVIVMTVAKSKREIEAAFGSK